MAAAPVHQQPMKVSVGGLLLHPRALQGRPLLGPLRVLAMAVGTVIEEDPAAGMTPAMPYIQFPFSAFSENALELALRKTPEPRLPWPVVSSYSMIRPLADESSTNAKVTGP